MVGRVMCAGRTRTGVVAAAVMGGSALALLVGAGPASGAEEITLQLRGASVHRCLPPVKRQAGTQTQNHNTKLKCRAGQKAYAVHHNRRYGFQVKLYVGGYEQ